ncbi:MAG: PKD domain-containing protein, partial [Anaerovorax sp.]
MKKFIVFLFLFLGLVGGYAANIKVLFIGNSYISVNNLPDLIYRVALSAGDTIEFMSSAPGGCTFEQHLTNNSANLIRQGGWDFVVLQEQSQRPAFPYAQFLQETYPYAQQLNDLILQYNPCAETVFYMTWGRKNGDSQNCQYFPPICTYEGMDDLLRERYEMMAIDNRAIISPAGPVWRYIRTIHPQIELYDTDESHPSLAGSYAVACSFYSVLFRKNPEVITYHSSLDVSVAQTIKTAVKKVVYDSLDTWLVGSYDSSTVADFSFSFCGSVVSFVNSSSNGNSYRWDFGDGNFSHETSPIHQYATEGSYLVTLMAVNCEQSDTVSVMVNMNTSVAKKVKENSIAIFPNP